MNSMTGFGSAEYTADTGITVRVDIVSYNKKQLDIRPVIAKELLSFEHIAKKIVSARVYRGAVTVRIDVSAADTQHAINVKINHKLAAAYVKQAEELTEKLKLSGSVDINNVLLLPGVIEEQNIEDLLDEKSLTKALDKALDAFISMREIEGKALEKDIEERLKKLIEMVDQIESNAMEIPEIQKQRLVGNLKNAGLTIDDDDERVLKEIVVFTDRSDVSEEITRLRSHFKQFNLLSSEDKPVGRSLEFLVQEMQREINTLGTKAAHSTVSPKIVEFKTELEKIREQIQNVE